MPSGQRLGGYLLVADRQPALLDAA